MSKWILDASALLALLNRERGSEYVVTALADGAAICVVNLSEVVAKLNEVGMPEEAIHEALDPLGLEIVNFDALLAYKAGMLRAGTKHAGLSLGDRACLALAQFFDVPVLTTDKIWESLSLNIAIRVIRQDTGSTDS